uniref:Uncharacterized protein n=1 Tax=Chaetoceros debilis TaxID=122233 RepID=A0A7S3Q0L5_9STRA
MVNPRLVAEDIAAHYNAKVSANSHLSHAQNVRRYLRKPVLAITRRILLPRINYDEIIDEGVAAIGMEGFGAGDSNGNDLVDPTAGKGKEGLDWRDYLIVPGSSRSGGGGGGGGRSGSSIDGSHHSYHHRRSMISEAFSMSETETETEIEGARSNVNRMSPAFHMKLSRRSLARMEAFLASCALAITNDSVKNGVVSVGVGNVKRNGNALSLMDGLKSSLPSFGLNKKSQPKIDTIPEAKAANGKPMPNKNLNYPQMHSNDLIVRLTLYIRTLRRVYANLHPTPKEIEANETETASASSKSSKSSPQQLQPGDECVIHLEPPRALKTHIRLLLNSLVYTVGTVGSMHAILTHLLTHLTLELLAVELISDNLQKRIRKIVLEYEHQISFASLAFLSTPEDSADANLMPLVARYVEYLRVERKACVFDCRLESTLARAMDPNLRRMFRTVEFRSIGHLLGVCKEYEKELEHIVISPRDASTLTANAIVSVTANTNTNGSGVNALSSTSFDSSTVEACSNTKAIKQALRDLRRETITINGQILPPPTSLSELVNLLRERLNSRVMKLKESKIGNVTSGNESANGSSTTSDSDVDFISSGCEGDGDTDRSPMRPRKKSIGGGESDDNTSSNTKDRQKECIVSNHSHISSSSTSKHPKRRIFNVDAIDILTRRFLIAASRTKGGGDAYFVVQDLFGGEGVRVIPSTESYRGPYNDGKVSATIELTVRLASITIKCHSKFDVYPEENIAECEPFIQLHTTTTETIELQEVRIDENGLELEAPVFSAGSNSEKSKSTSSLGERPTKVMLKEKSSESSGRRALSIKPARYVKVDNWKTPS